MGEQEALSGGVGSGEANRPGDVLWAKSALEALGRYPSVRAGEDRPDGALVDAIREFQKQRDLRPDGRLVPDGATMRSLRAALAELDEV